MMNADPLIPILTMFIIASVIAGGGLFLAVFLGPKKDLAVKLEPYECGMPITGTARDRISIKYYLVAILFLLFDLEAAFLIPAALAWDTLVQVGPAILFVMGFFMFFFVLGLWYELKVKAIEWEN